MPARCSVPGCKSNYRDAKVYMTVYSFPKDEKLRKVWCKAIGRENWTPSKYSTVCRNHFRDSDIINQVTWFDPKQGGCVTASLMQTRLKKTAVPSVFDNLYPVDPVSKRIIRARKEPQYKMCKLNSKLLKAVYPVSDCCESDDKSCVSSSASIVNEEEKKNEEVRPVKFNLRKILGLLDVSNVDAIKPNEFTEANETTEIPEEQCNSAVRRLTTQTIDSILFTQSNDEDTTVQQKIPKEVVAKVPDDIGEEAVCAGNEARSRFSEEVRKSGKVPKDITVKIFNALQNIISSNCDYKPVSLDTDNGNGDLRTASNVSVYEFPAVKGSNESAGNEQLQDSSTSDSDNPSDNCGEYPDRNRGFIGNVSSKNNVVDKFNVSDMPLFITKDVIENVHTVYNDIKNYEEIVVRYKVDEGDDTKIDELSLLQATKKINFYMTFVDDKDSQQQCMCVISLTPTSDSSIQCTYKCNRPFRKAVSDCAVAESVKVLEKKDERPVKTYQVKKLSSKLSSLISRIKKDVEENKQNNGDELRLMSGEDNKSTKTIDDMSDQLPSRSKYNLRHCKIDFRKLVGGHVNDDDYQVSSWNYKNKEPINADLGSSYRNDTKKRVSNETLVNKNKKQKKSNKNVSFIKEDEWCRDNYDILTYHRLMNKNLLNMSGQSPVKSAIKPNMKELKIVLTRCDFFMSESDDQYDKSINSEDSTEQNVDKHDSDEETIENIKLFISGLGRDNPPTVSPTGHVDSVEMRTTEIDPVDSLGSQSKEILITDVRGNAVEHLVSDDGESVDNEIYSNNIKMEIESEEDTINFEYVNNVPEVTEAGDETICNDKPEEISECVDSPVNLNEISDNVADCEDRVNEIVDKIGVIKPVDTTENNEIHDDATVSKGSENEQVSNEIRDSPEGNVHSVVFHEVTIATSDKEVPCVNSKECNVDNVKETVSTISVEEKDVNIVNDKSMEVTEVKGTDEITHETDTNKDIGVKDVDSIEDTVCHDIVNDVNVDDLDKYKNVGKGLVTNSEMDFRSNENIDQHDTVPNINHIVDKSFIIINEVQTNVPLLDYKEEANNKEVNEQSCENREIPLIDDKEINDSENNDVPSADTPNYNETINVAGNVETNIISETYKDINMIVDEALYGEDDCVFGHSENLIIVRQNVEGIKELDLEEEGENIEYVNNDDEVVVIKRSLDDIISEDSEEEFDNECEREVGYVINIGESGTSIMNEEPIDDLNIIEANLRVGELKEIIIGGQVMLADNSNTSSEKTIMCAICNKAINKDSMQRHLKRHSGTKFCPYCSKSFSDIADYNRHIMGHKENKGNEKYMCFICKKKFCFLKNIYKHMSNVHPDNTEHNDTIILLPDNGNNNKNDVFFSKERREKKRVMVNCSYCNQYFSAVYYKRHMLTHTGERPFKCEICDKRFFENSTLKNHLRTHTGERPYRCDICNKTFGHVSTLSKHLNIHTGLRRYQCDLCGKLMSSSYNLKSHRRIHTGEKPFECDWCRRKFTAKSGLEKHVATMHS